VRKVERATDTVRKIERATDIVRKIERATETMRESATKTKRELQRKRIDGTKNHLDGSKASHPYKYQKLYYRD